MGLMVSNGEPILFIRIDGRKEASASLTTLVVMLTEAIPQWAAKIHAYSRSLQALEAKLPADNELIREQDDLIANKRASIETLKQKYDDLMNLMPESQREELVQMRDKTTIAIERELAELIKAREASANAIKIKRGKIRKSESEMLRLKRVIPDFVRALTDLGNGLP